MFSPIFFFYFYFPHGVFVGKYGLIYKGLRRDKSPIHADRIHVHKSREEEEETQIYIHTTPHPKKIGVSEFFCM